MKLAIGDNIKSLRKSKNITQENLAEMLGVSCQSVSRWELGTCYPDMELLPELARIFNISVDQLLGEPSNHLDADAIEWLADRLRSSPQTILYISHDPTLVELADQKIQL